MEEFGNIEPVAIPPEEPPKRGPGRPRKDGTPAQPRATTGARRGRPPGSKRKRNLTNDIAGTLSLINFAFVFVPDDFKGDALDPDEINALAVAINAQAQENARFYDALMFLFGGGGSATLSLITVIGAIATKRLANHAIIPEDFAMRAGALLSLMNGGTLGSDIASTSAE